VSYDPARTAAYYDALGAREWDRFDRSVGDRVSLALHTELLERYATRGDRVLDVGAGPGRFTEILHRAGCRITVADLSATQIELNRAAAAERGFAASVDGWHQADICDLSALPAEAFDGVVAFGGPLSYVFGQRERALAECLRVLRREGYLLLSVMSLWGTLHRHRRALRDMPPELTAAIVAHGDLTPQTDPTTSNFCHLYRAAELRRFLTRPGVRLELLSASSALMTGVEHEFLTDPGQWPHVLRCEREAVVEEGCLDAGTHLLAAARKTASAATT